MATLFGGRPCTDPADLLRSCQDQGLPTDWWGRANLYRNPLGRGPGTGGLLLTGADLDALDLTTDQTLTFADDAGDTVTLKRITLLRARCLTPGYAGDPRAVYLCDVVDRRRFLANSPVDRGYNLKNSDGTGYLSASLNSGSAWTWAGVVQDVWTALGLGTAPALPFTPDGTPENLKYHGADAWEALNDVLDRLACSVFYDPAADTFAFVRLGDAAASGATAFTSLKASLDRDSLRLWDAYWREPDRGRLPEKVRVLFPRRPLPTDGSSPYYAVDVTLTATTGVAAGSYVQLHDDLTAVGSGTPTNASALTTRANERAADWRRKRVGFERRLTLIYRDFRAALKPGELVAAGALDDRGGPMATEIDSGPDGAVERFRAWEPPVTFPADTGTAGPDDCRSSLRGLTKYDCVTIAVVAGSGRCANVAAAELAAPWSEDVGRWVTGGTFTTAAGATTAEFYFDAHGQPAARIVAGTKSMRLALVGCVGGWLEFAAAGCDWCDTPADPDCTDHTFRLRVKCGCTAPGCAAVCTELPGGFAVDFSIVDELGTGSAEALGTGGTYWLTYHDVGDFAWGAPPTTVLGRSDLVAPYPGYGAGRWFGRARLPGGTLYLYFTLVESGGACTFRGGANYVSDADLAGYAAAPDGYVIQDSYFSNAGYTFRCAGQQGMYGSYTAGFDPAASGATAWDCDPSFVGRVAGCADDGNGASAARQYGIEAVWGTATFDPCTDPGAGSTLSGGGGFNGTVP